ncbi:MAG TPA: PAS domain-containing protein [Firmicutes bacterium]|nr:PAS domain-containing protein [Bacillota bacterium]
MGYIQVKEANCKNCYKCLKHCDVKSISYINDRVEVIADQCILCGHCVNVCPQKAKTVVNDITGILGWLADPSVRVVASLAPSYAGLYGSAEKGESAAGLRAALYRLGFDAVEETAVGANEVTAAYKDLLDEGKMDCILTTCCPTVNSLVTKYYPSLVPFMAPVVSPVLAHGRMIKARDGADTKVVFIGPCLSKIKEIDDHPESADGVITFRQLDALLSERGMEPSAVQAAPEAEECPPAPSAPFSRIYPVPEGVVRDVKLHSHKGFGSSAYNGYRFLSVCGLENVMAFLDELQAGHCGRLFVELNSCEGGCVNGPLIPEERRASFRARLSVEEYAADGFESVARAGADLALRFEPEARREDMPDERTIRKILTEIGKPTPDKELNCGSCGYNTCRDKAIAVYRGKAELYMCLPYMIDLSQSLSNVTLSVTPNYIIAVDRDLRIVEFNQMAQKKFGVSRQEALKADLFEYMDPEDFQEVLDTHRNIVNKKTHLDSKETVVEETLMYVPEQDIVIGFFKDITDEERQKEEARRARLEAAEMAQKVIDKQMTVAQEIASLLGETTAETKVTLVNLKKQMLNEGDPS